MVFINTYKKRKFAPGCLCMILKGWESPMRWCWEDGERGHSSSVCLLPDSFLSNSLGPITRGKGISVFILLPLLRWLIGQESTCYAGNTGDEGSTPELARSPGGGNGKPLQHPCWENIPFAEKPGRLQSMGSQSRKTKLAHTHHCSVLEGGLRVFEGRA